MKGNTRIVNKISKLFSHGYYSNGIARNTAWRLRNLIELHNHDDTTIHFEYHPANEKPGTKEATAVV